MKYGTSIYCGKIVAESVEDAFHKILYELRRYGEKSSPRGYEVTELQNVNVVIKNPRNRIVGCPERKFSAPYAFGELAWYLSGNNNLDQICYYSKFQERCSDDGVTLNSAYGARIFGVHPDGESLLAYYPKIEFNQWQQCVKILNVDPDSRQAIIHLHTPNDRPTKDEVCTLTLQFLIRNGQLNMITTMRSNDVLLGFTYDAFAFTVMQELMANELGVELGYYCHNVGSMHVYTKEYYGRDTDILFEHTRADVAPMQPIGFMVGSRGMNFILEMEKQIRRTALRVESEENDIVKKVLIEQELHLLELLDVIPDEFTAMAMGAYLVKMFGYVHNYEGQCQTAQKLREGGFEFAADICALFIKNALNGAKVILEGPDGAGKSAMAGNLFIKCLQSGQKYDIIHYVGASDIFNYNCGYTFHLQHKRAEIFDRFVFSEIVYSKVYGRKCQVSCKKYKQILRMLEELGAEVNIIIAVGENQRRILCERRNAEDDPEKILQLNDEYIKLIKKLRTDVPLLEVHVFDIFGHEINGEENNG